MLTKNQVKILKVFKEDIFKEITFKDIKQMSKQKSNNIPLIALKEFKKLNLIQTKETADVKAYSLDLNNNLTLSYLNLINEIDILNNKIIPKKIMQELQDRVSKYTNFFTLIVFGSYAKGTATKKSDLDIAVIVDNAETKKEIIPLIETIKRREIIKIDYNVFTEKEFLEMLTNEEQNVGKEIYRTSIIYYGLIEYYRLIKRLKHEQHI
ncbi:MAG: nucleotidyltransferase domain-containing protein [Candidatus Pacearchaeota archaeon]|jgi:predicted nucleotidyltransferase